MGINLIVEGDEGVSPLVADLTYKWVVLAYKFLPRQYQQPRFQIIRPFGGPGCKIQLNGIIYARHAADGQDVHCHRFDLIGMCSDELAIKAAADTTPVASIDLNLHEYLLIARDGHNERGDTVEQARQRLMRITHAEITEVWSVHPESKVNDMGVISYPDGAPPVEIPVIKGKIWTAKY
jgi:hypothetical protein